ncbi:SDR family NAD(P)-dependent oxidoreductase (plasmid) [Nostoc edaphicum CCNP1411]|uniref:SDR family NAD(P)-dependent oxidoreductase n=1 Tax=Nostoc edaphicum CCNP1411 TaxID=1472755 RepID=A0A7D7L9R9_9NOSO|nr:oxidoreductase [Nostoc edaphicum]QMS86254.1 SDR family NAD(P)-dependent oxidoreductase [Nostoc edaphicum CCNP1411]
MSETTSQNRVWFITGISSGFGKALADTVLERGDYVFGTVRQERQIRDFEDSAPGRAFGVQVDVTKPKDVHAGVETAIASFGRIDVLVNNAGYALLGAVEEIEDQDIRRQFDTNFFGALDLTRTVLPHMRSRRSGHIINISSIGGLVGASGWGIYCGSKFALEGLSESLALEVAHLGIRVTIVEPGAFRTNLGGNGTTISQKVIEDYAESSGRTRQWRENSRGREPGDPVLAAKAIISAVESPEPPLRLVLGADALQFIRKKLTSLVQELDHWEDKTLSTDIVELQ